MEGLRNKAVSGIKWTTVSAAVTAAVQILKISILSRFIDKADFGLMALVVFVLGFMNLFMDMGLSSAILHKQDITKKQYASLYWLNLIFSLALYVMILLITPVVSSFYSQTELLTLLPLMGLGLILSAIGRQFKTIFQKELRFRKIAVIDIVAAVTSLLLSVFLAIKGYGIYALIYPSLFQYFVSNISFWISGIKTHGMKFHFSFIETKPFLKVGVYQVGSQVVNYFSRDADVLIIGKIFGAEILGGYSLAKQLVFRPAQIINPILTNVASPVLVKYQKDLLQLKANYLKLVNIVATINIPVYLILAAFASPIVAIIYGPGFEEIVVLVRILSFFMMIRAVGNPIGSLVIASGRTDLEFYWNLISLITLPVAVIIGAQHSVIGVALSLVFFHFLLFVPSWYFLVWKICGISLKNYLRSMLINYKVVYMLRPKKIIF
jgi:O-antigen/teichoic acid export membrane protein